MTIWETIKAFVTIMWGLTALLGIAQIYFFKRNIGWERVWYSKHQWDEWMPPVFASCAAFVGFFACIIFFYVY